MAHEAYKELVTSTHLIQVWSCESWGKSGLSRFWPNFQDFLNVHPLAGLGLGGCSQVSAELRVSQSGCLGVVLSPHDEGQQVIVTSGVPVNLGVVFHKPHVADDDGCPANTSDVEGGSF